MRNNADLYYDVEMCQQGVKLTSHNQYINQHGERNASYKILHRSKQIHCQVGWCDGMISKMNFIALTSFLYPLKLQETVHQQNLESDIVRSVK